MDECMPIVNYKTINSFVYNTFQLIQNRTWRGGARRCCASRKLRETSRHIAKAELSQSVIDCSFDQFEFLVESSLMCCVPFAFHSCCLPYRLTGCVSHSHQNRTLHKSHQLWVLGKWLLACRQLFSIRIYNWNACALCKATFNRDKPYLMLISYIPHSLAIYSVCLYPCLRRRSITSRRGPFIRGRFELGMLKFKKKKYLYLKYWSKMKWRNWIFKTPHV